MWCRSASHGQEGEVVSPSLLTCAPPHVVLPPTVMHTAFQHDLYRLRLETARAYVSSVSRSMLPVSTSLTDSLKISAQVSGGCGTVQGEGRGGVVCEEWLLQAVWCVVCVCVCVCVCGVCVVCVWCVWCVHMCGGRVMCLCVTAHTRARRPELHGTVSVT